MFRLKGHGTATGKSAEVGDLYATVGDIQLPRELTPEQRTHFELRELEKGATGRRSTKKKPRKLPV